jgi:hypothetical protein
MSNFLPIVLVLSGIVLVSYGVLKLTGFLPTTISQDSEYDKKNLSRKTRFFIGKYIVGWKAIAAGLALAGFGYILFLS